MANDNNWFINFEFWNIYKAKVVLLLQFIYTIIIGSECEYNMQLGIRMDYEERNERALYRHNHSICLIKLFVTSNIPSQFFFQYGKAFFFNNKYFKY